MVHIKLSGEFTNKIVMGTLSHSQPNMTTKDSLIIRKQEIEAYNLLNWWSNFLNLLHFEHVDKFVVS